MTVYRLNCIPHYEYAETVVHLNQGEKGSKIGFTVYDGDTYIPFGAYDGAGTITLNIYKADGTVYSELVGDVLPEDSSIYDTAEMEEGYFEVTLKEQMTAAAGKCIAEFVFVAGSVKKASANFIIDVERSPLDMDGVESESFVNYVEGNRQAALAATQLLNGLVDHVTELVERAESAAESAVNAGVASFNLRNGVVSPEAGDYSADMIAYGSGTVEDELEALTTRTARLFAITSGTTNNIAVSAESGENIAIPVSITAECKYMPLGVIKYTMGTQYVYVWKFDVGTVNYQAEGGTIRSSVTITAGVRNPHSINYAASPTIYVLWARNDT